MSVVVRETDASGSIVVEKGGEDTWKSCTAPDKKVQVDGGVQRLRGHRASGIRAFTEISLRGFFPHPHSLQCPTFGSTATSSALHDLQVANRAWYFSSSSGPCIARLASALMYDSILSLNFGLAIFNSHVSHPAKSRPRRHDGAGPKIAHDMQSTLGNFFPLIVTVVAIMTGLYRLRLDL